MGKFKQKTKEPVNMTIDKSLIQKIDSQKSPLSRSAYVNMVLHEHFENKELVSL